MFIVRNLDTRYSSAGLAHEQRRSALENANRVRTGLAEVRKEVSAGTLAAVDALTDERAAALTIGALLLAQRRWGPKRVRELLRRLELRETKRLGELTQRQRGIVTDALGRCSR